MKSDTKLYYTKYNIRKQKKKYNYVSILVHAPHPISNDYNQF